MNFKKYHVSRNLLPSPVSATVESAGIKIESTGDGTITVSGTRTSGDSPTINLKEAVTLNGTYYAHFRNNVAAPSSTIVLRNGTTSIVNITLTSTNLITQITLSNVTIDNIQVYVTPGTSINAQMAISIEQTESVTPYEPYSSEVWHDIPHYIHNTSTDTITTLPAVLYPNDTTATVGLKGQMEQSGTPTPDNPIMPQGTGERTENLFELTDSSATADTLKTLVDFGEDVTFDTITCSCVFENLEAEFDFGAFLDYLMDDGTHQYVALSGMRNANDDSRIPTNVKVNGNYYNTKRNITFRKIQAYLYPAGYNKFKSGSIKWAFYDSEKKDYEPYGYKIPISSAGQTTPVYLGEVETTRKIKKLVLTGNEDWKLWSSGQPDVERYYYKWGKVTPSDYGLICTHLPFNSGDGNFEHIRLGGSNREDFIIFISKTIAPTVADFKSYLAQQYAAGTPVTAWYVLATETTGIVNEPLMKIGDYADEVSGISISTTAGVNTLSVGTTVQPSEVIVNYKGWHPIQSTHEYNSNYTIATMQTLTIAQLQAHTISELQGGGWL